MSENKVHLILQRGNKTRKLLVPKDVHDRYNFHLDKDNKIILTPRVVESDYKEICDDCRGYGFKNRDICESCQGLGYITIVPGSLPFGSALQDAAAGLMEEDSSDPELPYYWEFIGPQKYFIKENVKGGQGVNNLACVTTELQAERIIQRLNKYFSHSTFNTGAGETTVADDVGEDGSDEKLPSRFYSNLFITNTGSFWATMERQDDDSVKQVYRSEDQELVNQATAILNSYYDGHPWFDRRKK